MDGPRRRCRISSESTLAYYHGSHIRNEKPSCSALDLLDPLHVNIRVREPGAYRIPTTFSCAIFSTGRDGCQFWGSSHYLLHSYA